MQQKKFAVIGHPIAHSLSKPMHEAVFKELNLPHTYDAIDILPENLESFIKSNPYDGINVTIPHKVEVMKHIDEIKNEAKQIQAVNTIKFNRHTDTPNTEHRNQKLEIFGYNTDAIGFSKSLEEEGINLQNKNVLVIGAGGVSRAILISLKNNNANITLTNRTKQKAINLIKELNIDAKIIDYTPEFLKQELQNINIIVNTTSIGMKSSGHLPSPISNLPTAETKGFSPASIGMHQVNTPLTTHDSRLTTSETKGFSPIPKHLLSPNHIIFDAIYNPLETKLIKDAKTIGCKTISGVNMLIHQGAQSLRIWLNINPPIQTMKDEVLKNLQPKS